MGQEFGASAPFLYFTDHKEGLARLVSQGRRRFLEQFPSIMARKGEIPNPNHEKTFLRSKLDHGEREKNKTVFDFHRDLLRLRRADVVFAAQDRSRLDGAVLKDGAFVIRYFGRDGDDRLVLVNLGDAVRYHPCPEPLLASPANRPWRLRFSSDAPRYGGRGRKDPLSADVMVVPPRSAWIFRPANAH
jgi:maltooligosyltrehalose trehalohydrolase